MPARKSDKSVLTDRALRALKPAPPGKRVIHWDAACPNFGVRVTDTGHRTFIVMRRLPGEAHPVRQVVGTYPAMSLADARRAVPAILAMIERGEHPREVAVARRQEEARRRADTFGAVAEDFIERHVAQLRSARPMEAVIRRELMATWSDRPIREIKRRDVIHKMESIVDRGRLTGNGPKSGGIHAARKALAAATKLFGWAVERDLIEQNPTVGIKANTLLGAPTARDRVLADDELAVIWRAATATPYPFGPLVCALLLTGQRLREIAELRWPEVDLEGRLLTIPAERMKGKTTHTVPLTPSAEAIFRELPRFTGGDYVFTTTGGARPIAGFSKFKARLDRVVSSLAEDAGVTIAPWTLHDLRRTVRTGLSSAGVLPVTAELVIGHKQTGIAAVYDRHRYSAEKRDALMRWEEKLNLIVRSADKDQQLNE